jgi:molybdenum cofactor cytidylyltransferase
MQMRSLQTGVAPVEVPDTAVVCHDVRNPEDRNEILVRKGTSIWSDEISSLLARGVGELHLAVPDPGDLGEDEAAARLARAVIGPGAELAAAHSGQVSLISTGRGMLRVHAGRLERANAVDGVLVLTAESDRPVDAGTTIGIVKCAPLLLPEAALSAVEHVASTGPVVEVRAFEPRRVALVAPRTRLRAGAFDRARDSLATALAWYGSSLDLVIGTEGTAQAIADAHREVHRRGAELILAAGASGTDPLDISFEGLRLAGGQVVQIGIPAEPGTACWIGQLDSIPVLGLATCELFGKPGALDLLLPRLLTGERLDRQLARSLANGGLLNGPARIAPYHAQVLAGK